MSCGFTNSTSPCVDKESFFLKKKRSFHLVEVQVPALKPGEKPVGCLFRWCEAVLTQMLKQTSVS